MRACDARIAKVCLGVRRVMFENDPPPPGQTEQAVIFLSISDFAVLEILARFNTHTCLYTIVNIPFKI